MGKEAPPSRGGGGREVTSGWGRAAAGAIPSIPAGYWTTSPRVFEGRWARFTSPEGARSDGACVQGAGVVASADHPPIRGSPSRRTFAKASFRRLQEAD